LEAALDGEITDHLGYDKGDPAGKNGGNSRNGARAKTVLTDVGPVDIAVPRDRDGSFQPQIVRKRQRRLTGVDDMVISLSAKGLTTGEIQAHLAEVYGAEVSRQTISTITDKVLDAMGEWQNRPLDGVYPVIFLDAVHVKIRDGKVAKPADLRRPRGHRRGHPRHPRVVGRRRRRGCQVLAAAADRAAQPGCRGRLHGGL
jgi:putative transposase